RCTWSALLDPGDGPRAEDHGVPGSCPLCGAPTRPDVVLFDEQLPQDALELAMRPAQRADLLVVVGDRGVGFPSAQLAPLAAAQLAPRAASHGATTVLIDIAPPFGSSELFDHVIAEDAHEVLPDWERRLHRVGGTSFLEPFPG